MNSIIWAGGVHDHDRGKFEPLCKCSLIAIYRMQLCFPVPDFCSAQIINFVVMGTKFGDFKYY